jgi:uncharacterized protein HemX
MAVDQTTMTIITAVGGTGLTIGGALWAHVKSQQCSIVKELKRQNEKLEARASECEEDRINLHGRLNDQSERITGISQILGRLEGRMEHIAKDQKA